MSHLLHSWLRLWLTFMAGILLKHSHSFLSLNLPSIFWTVHSILWQWFNPRLGGRYNLSFSYPTKYDQCRMHVDDNERWVWSELKLFLLFFLFQNFHNQKINFIANKFRCFDLFCGSNDDDAHGFINKMRSLVDYSVVVVVVVVVVVGIWVFLAQKETVRWKWIC